MEEKITAFQILDFSGFCKSVVDEAFSESALTVGKSFFKKNKKDIGIFKTRVIENKKNLIPDEKFVYNEVFKRTFKSDESINSYFILPKDINIIVDKLSDQISYNILSSLTNDKVLEMCYSSKNDDIIWRVRK